MAHLSLRISTAGQDSESGSGLQALQVARSDHALPVRRCPLAAFWADPGCVEDYPEETGLHQVWPASLSAHSLPEPLHRAPGWLVGWQFPTWTGDGSLRAGGRAARIGYPFPPGWGHWAPRLVRMGDQPPLEKPHLPADRLTVMER